MTIRTYPELVQGSDEWLQARCGLLTASVIGKLITPSTLKPADNETSRGVIMTLAAERITGHVEYVHPTFDMMRGTDDEPFAREKYAKHYAPVTELGFIVREEYDWSIGYSPDGLVGNDGLIEIKSRKPREQIKTFLTDRVPAYNMGQLQTGLLITGRAWIDYVSYSAGLPLYVKRVYPDTAWHAAIDATAQRFEAEVQTIISRFDTASTGYPTTERRPELEDIRI